MKITDFLNAQSVIPALEGREKSAALEEMAGLLASCHPRLTQKKVLDVLVAREKISTTAIGEGVAIPHGKLAGVDRVLGVFARSPEGVEFASLDGEPTHLFFALIAPENAAADLSPFEAMGAEDLELVVLEASFRTHSHHRW